MMLQDGSEHEDEENKDEKHEVQVMLQAHWLMHMFNSNAGHQCSPECLIAQQNSAY